MADLVNDAGKKRYIRGFSPRTSAAAAKRAPGARVAAPEVKGFCRGSVLFPTFSENTELASIGDRDRFKRPSKVMTQFRRYLSNQNCVVLFFRKIE